MRAFAAVFAREVAERRMVFLVGLFCGVLFLFAAASHGWNAPGNAEVRLLAGSVGGLTLGAALALLYGGSVIAGETGEKRISFYFSRPIPAAAIWGGKLLAAIFVSFTAGLLVFVPAWLAGPAAARRPWGFDLTPGLSMAIGLSVVATCVLAAHAFVTVARLRSPWVALDLLLAPTLVLLAVASVFSLARDRFFGILQNGASANLPPLFEGLAVVLLVGLAAASYAQVAAGRTDARRAHGAFSVVLWAILGSATAALGGFAWWAGSARATDLVTVDGGILAAPRGAWTLLGGPLGAGRGYGLFLFDAAGARSIRTRSGSVAFSADGTRAAWGEVRFGFLEMGTKSALVVADLGATNVVDTGLECSRWSRVALSPSGRRLAVLDGNNLAAYDVTQPAHPQQLAAFQIEGEARHAVFVDESVIRLFPRFYNAARRDAAPAALEITEFSLSSKKSLVTGRFDRDSLPYLRLSADGRTLIGVKDNRLALLDGRTGALIATLSEDLESPKARFLSGGCNAVAGVANSRAQLKIFLEGERAPARTIDLGPAASVVLGGEIAPGRIAVALNSLRSNDERSRGAWKLALVDVTTGAVSPGPAGLVLADRFGWWFNSVIPPAEASSPASSLFLDADSRLVRLDPATGAQTVLLGKGK